MCTGLSGAKRGEEEVKCVSRVSSGPHLCKPVECDVEGVSALVHFSSAWYLNQKRTYWRKLFTNPIGMNWVMGYLTPRSWDRSLISKCLIYFLLKRDFVCV